MMSDVGFNAIAVRQPRNIAMNTSIWTHHSEKNVRTKIKLQDSARVRINIRP